jgi:hypothetical protein
MAELLEGCAAVADVDRVLGRRFRASSTRLGWAQTPAAAAPPRPSRLRCGAVRLQSHSTKTVVLSLLVVDLAGCDLEHALELYDIAYLHLSRPAAGDRPSDTKELETVARARAGDIATHVVVGRPANGARDRIVDLAHTRGEWEWTVPRVAMAGDLVLFYLLNPDGQFVATGQLLSDAQPGSSKEGAGKYVADVGEVNMLAAPVARLDAVDRVSGWGWPRQPHTETTVPHEHIDALASLIRL